MHSLLQDVRFSLRLIRKRPGMSVLVLAALVLGIGVNSAVFSVVNADLLRPVPLSAVERVAFIYAKSPQSAFVSVSYPEFQDWKEQSRSFQDMAVFQFVSFSLKQNGQPEHLLALATSASYFKIMGISPAMGRDFIPTDDLPGAARVAVLSHRLWQRRFGGDPAILGKTIVLDSQVYSVVGVLPPNDLPPFGWDLWVGLGPFLDQRLMNREMRHFYAVGRLAPAADLPHAQQEMETIAGRLAEAYPKSNKDMGAHVESVTDQFLAGDRKALSLIVVASGLVLLLACVNVITVFIASAIERRKELSVRLALGAARAAILRQLFVQSLIFATVGGSLGLLLAKAGLAYLIHRFPAVVFRFRETTIDHTVVWFTICLALGSTLLSSILPGLYTARLNINTELKGEWSGTVFSKYRSLGQGALIVLEVAMAAGLSLVSGLLIKSFYELQKVNLGFSPRHVVSFLVSLPDAEYKDDTVKAAFYQRAVDNLKAIPGVESASATFTLPLVTGTHFINLQVDSSSPHAAERPFVDSDMVSPGFLATLKIPIIQGRDFTDADRAGASPVAIVDELLAARMWPGESPLGKRLRLADITDNGPPWREIVGVVPQVKYAGPEGEVERAQVYEPLYQHPTSVTWFVMNTTTSFPVLRPPTEKAIHDLAPDLSLDRFRLLDDFLDQREAPRRVSLVLLSGFAAMGIALGMIGIYGVVSNSVVRRRREIAIRMALGATIRSSIVLVTRLGLLATLVGIALGSILVISLTSVLSAYLFGVSALDPRVYLFGAGAIAALALVASVIPAATLLRLSPQDVLRE